jgi:ribonuclease Y
MVFDLTTLVIVLVSVIAGSIAGYFARQSIARRQHGSLEARLKEMVNRAKEEARETLISAKEKSTQVLEEAKKSESEMRRQLLRNQERLLKREEILEKKVQEHEDKENKLRGLTVETENLKQKLEGVKDNQLKKLEEIANFTKSEAKDYLMKMIEKASAEDLVKKMKKLEEDTFQKLESKAKEILTTIIQRYARSHIADVTTSVVHLPSDELKGKIIGREGRNIKTLERLTGVEVIVDDTPEAITLSSFDPVRRAVASLALEKLIKDGRIQPARIEEKVEEAKEEINRKIQESGEAAVYELGIFDLPKQIIYLLGRLNYRTSYGQSVLMHSIEAAHIAGMLASELGANIEISKKGALLHDIGKAIDHEVEGTHLELGRKILQKYSVDELIVKAMQSHHEDYPYETLESIIVTVAEAMSAARPGARRDTVENYIKRLEELEKIAGSFDGIDKVYAIQAGREVRVFVRPDNIDDLGAMKLARQIADRIEQEVKYPGEVKINVIRESRAIEYAR